MHADKVRSEEGKCPPIRIHIEKFLNYNRVRNLGMQLDRRLT